MVAVTGEMWRNDVVVMSDGSHVDQPSASSGLLYFFGLSAKLKCSIGYELVLCPTVQTGADQYVAQHGLGWLGCAGFSITWLDLA